MSSITTRRAIFGSTAAMMATAALPAAASASDAEIFRICKLHADTLAALNAYDGSDSAQADRLYAAYLRNLKALIEAEPQTIAGLIAKAQSSKLEHDDEDLRRSVIANLLRLKGGAA